MSSFIHLVIHSLFEQILLSTYHMPGIVLTTRNKTKLVPTPHLGN